MSKAEQLPLDLGHRPAYAREDLWISGSNADAVAWLDKWPAWGGPALVLYGPPASGKTHLAHVWRKMSAAVDLGAKDPAALAGLLLPGDVPRAAILEGVEAFIGAKESETALFHLYNRAKEQGAFLLLTAEHPPKDWAFVLPDLKSRLLSAPAAAVGSPDEHLMAVVLTKLFSDRQIFVSQDVVQFIVARIERSFAAMRDLVERLDKKALAEKRPITVPLAREVLQAQGRLL